MRRESSCLRALREPHGASSTTIGSPASMASHSSACASQPPRAAHASSPSTAARVRTAACCSRKGCSAKQSARTLVGPPLHSTTSRFGPSCSLAAAHSAAAAASRAAAALACVLLCCYRCLARRRLSVRASSYASTEASLKAPPISPDDVDDESLLRSRHERYESRLAQAEQRKLLGAPVRA